MKVEKETKRKILKMVERVTRFEIEKNNYPGPPYCTGIFHQPKRPR